MSFIIFYITFPDPVNANSIVDTVVKEKLAACGNIFPITSKFWWKDEMQGENETVAIVKTTHEKANILSERLEELHPYDVPCLMRIEVNATDSYENWIQEAVS